MKHRLARNLRRSYWFRNLIGVPIAFVLFAIFYNTGRFAYNLITPRSHVINYIEYNARQERGEIVLSVVRSGVDGTQLSFIDSLQCTRHDQPRFLSISESSGFVRRSGITEYEFQFMGVLPDTDAMCSVRSLITAHLPYGITKTQVVTTPEFEWRAE